MAFMMSGLLTVINTGVDNGLVQRWLRSFLIAWPIAFVLVLLLATRVRAFVAVLCRD